MKINEGLKRAFLDALFDGVTAPTPAAITVSIDKLGKSILGSRLEASLTVNIVDKEGTPLVCICQVNGVGEGDTLTLADVHRAFDIRISA